jgi:hypothetical protein
MSRDHTAGKGDPYIECAICAITIRKSTAIEQRGLLVCPACVDDSPPDPPGEN